MSQLRLLTGKTVNVSFGVLFRGFLNAQDGMAWTDTGVQLGECYSYQAKGPKG